MKNFIFLLGWQMGGPITTWIEEISTPHLCIMCFITFMGSSKANLVLEKLDRKLGLATPPPQLGQNPKYFQKFQLKASLRMDMALFLFKRRGEKLSLSFYVFYIKVTSSSLKRLRFSCVIFSRLRLSAKIIWSPNSNYLYFWYSFVNRQMQKT